MDFQLDSDDKLDIAAQVISFIKKASNQYDDLRKKLVKPLQDHVKQINEMFKKETDPLEKADAIMRKKMIDYKISKEVKPPQTEALVDEVKPEIKSVGAATFKKYWTFEIENLDNVPRQYLIPDSVKINEAIKSGVREISGIKIYQKETIATR